MSKKLLITMVLFMLFVCVCTFSVSAYEYTINVENVLSRSNINNTTSELGGFTITRGTGSYPSFIVNGTVVNGDRALLMTLSAYSFRNGYFYVYCDETCPFLIEIEDLTGIYIAPINALVRINYTSKIYIKWIPAGTSTFNNKEFKVGVFNLPVYFDFENKNLNIDEMINGYKEESYSSGVEIGYVDGYAEGTDVGYNSGYVQGSEEGYTNGFAEGHECGYTNGFYAGGDVGYESGITQGEELGFNNGYAAGGDNYKLSTEYDIAIADAWNAGRSNGYKAGYKDKASEFNPLTLVIPLLTVCELALVITVIVKKIRRRKRT